MQPSTSTPPIQLNENLIPSEVKLSVISPVFNEEPNLRPLCDQLRKVLDSLSSNYEIILVNDGSTDNGGTLLDALSEKDPCIKVVHLRRNSGQAPATLTADLAIDDGGGAAVDLLALDEALTAFGEEYERPARVVSLRFFAGLSIPNIAELLGVTSRTIDREFLFARTWLRRFLSRE